MSSFILSTLWTLWCLESSGFAEDCWKDFHIRKPLNWGHRHGILWILWFSIDSVWMDRTQLFIIVDHSWRRTVLWTHRWQRWLLQYRHFGQLSLSTLIFLKRAVEYSQIVFTHVARMSKLVQVMWRGKLVQHLVSVQCKPAKDKLRPRSRMNFICIHSVLSAWAYTVHMHTVWVLVSTAVFIALNGEFIGKCQCPLDRPLHS